MADICLLLADNDPDYSATCAEFLRSVGYQVHTAASPAEAGQLLEAVRVHLAILDLRLSDDDDQKDKSGLTLAKETARSIPKLILTKFPIHQDVREALKLDAEVLPPAVDYVDKKEGLNGLLRVIEQALAKHVRINWDLNIHWGEPGSPSFPYLVNLIEPDLPSERLVDRVRELEDLFRKLFYEKSQLIVSRLLWRRDRRVCLTLFAYSPEGALEQRVVTCGLRAPVGQEVARYKGFAPKGGVGTTLTDFAETMHFAAVAYALPGADLEQTRTFEAFYRTNKAAQVRTVLEHLFQTTLAPWHQRKHILGEVEGLSWSYCQGLGEEALPQDKLQERMQALAREALSLGPTQMELSASELSLRFPNGDTISCPSPVPYVREEAVERDVPVVCVSSPGDLSSDNVLVGPGGQTRVTDFGQAGSVPLLWDFVWLEAAVRFDLTESTDVQALHHFESRLVAPAQLNQRLDTQDMDAPFRKALAVIQHIRRLADAESGSDPLPYYKGLLLRALSEVKRYEPDIKHTPQQLGHFVHALLASAMICDKLVGPAARHVLSENSQIVKGIEIDEPKRQVSVEGRQVRLGRQEYDLLLYLYQHAGQLCTLRSIVEEALNDTYAGDAQEADRLRTLVSRVRKKIEPYPGEQRYLRTIHGQGYTLYLAKREDV
jgi:DNA-binding response OmpR family regulator